MSRVADIFVRLIELGLFCFAFFMVIPEVPSDAPHHYRLTPTLLIGGSAFALSLWLAVRRGGEHWSMALLKLLFYVAFAWAVLQRILVHVATPSI
jgi:hypothetical protein